MKIYLATWLTDKSLGRSLTKKKASRRLLSFHFIKEQRITNEQLKQYCETGRLNPRKNADK